MKKEIKNPKEKMLIQIKIEVMQDGRSANHFKDAREENLVITRSEASQLMDNIESVITAKI